PAFWRGSNPTTPRPAAPLLARGDPQKSPAEERADQLSSMLLRPALLCCTCPQQRQLSELLAPLSLCRLLTDAFALLREPLEHTCDVHRKTRELTEAELAAVSGGIKDFSF